MPAIETQIEYRVAATKDTMSVKAGRKLSGLAAPYSVRTRIGVNADKMHGGRNASFDEIIAPGAFRSILSTRPDCCFLINHNASAIMGRTSAGTLRLADTSQGLAFEVDLPQTRSADELHTAVSRGDIRGMSFGFLTTPEDVLWADGAVPLRTIRGFSKLLDVSAVTFPAYGSTHVAARLECVPVEVRAEALRQTGASAADVEAAVFEMNEREAFEWHVMATKRAAAAIF